MRSLLVSVLIGLAGGTLACSRTADDVDLGAVDRETQPALKDLVEPKDDKGISRVNLRATVTGERKLKKGKNVYVLVNPLSNPTTAKNTWWVQEPVNFDGDRLQATCQFGEPGEGGGEHFAIVVFETDEEYETGQKLNALPKGKAWTKFTIVKRN
jgi:hypothetical protein